VREAVEEHAYMRDWPPAALSEAVSFLRGWVEASVRTATGVYMTQAEREIVAVQIKIALKGDARPTEEEAMHQIANILLSCPHAHRAQVMVPCPCPKTCMCRTTETEFGRCAREGE
jgi:hypothetical protein